MGYSIGAAAAARPTGIAWEDVSRSILYQPLGMRSTSSRYADYIAARDRDPARPLGGGVGPEDSAQRRRRRGTGRRRQLDRARHGEYLRLQLRDGKLGARQVIPAAALNETRTAQVSTGSGYYSR